MSEELIEALKRQLAELSSHHTSLVAEHDEQCGVNGELERKLAECDDCICEAELVLESAGRPEGERLSDGIQAIVGQLAESGAEVIEMRHHAEGATAMILHLKRKLTEMHGLLGEIAAKHSCQCGCDSCLYCRSRDLYCNVEHLSHDRLGLTSTFPVCALIEDWEHEKSKAALAAGKVDQK